MKVVILFFVVFFVGFNAQADDVSAVDGSYAIQLGAYKKPDMTIFSILDEYGSVYTEQATDGLTRIMIGNYASRSEAESVLQQIRGIGFGDAFLRFDGDVVGNIDALPVAETISSSVYSSNSEGYINPESLPIWNQLSDYQRESVIYLDGVLHIEEDGKFIPLADYARRMNH